ncbi:MAG: hypothetical protein WKF75_12075 [Singulisphaera sp.]
MVVGERFNRINELVVIYRGDRAPPGKTEGLTIVDRRAPAGSWWSSRRTASAQEIQKLAQNDAVQYVEPNYRRLLETPRRTTPLRQRPALGDEEHQRQGRLDEGLPRRQ